MFLTHRFDADSIPEVNIGYLNSTCYFLFEAFRLGVYPQKDVLVLKALMSYYTVYLTHNAPSVEEITTYYLMEYAKKTCFGFDSKIFDELQQNLTQRIVSLRYLKWTAASQLGWNMLLYREIFFDDRYLKLPILDTSVEMVTESESLGAKFYYLFAK